MLKTKRFIMKTNKLQSWGKHLESIMFCLMGASNRDHTCVLTASVLTLAGVARRPYRVSVPFSIGPISRFIDGLPGKETLIEIKSLIGVCLSVYVGSSLVILHCVLGLTRR